LARSLSAPRVELSEMHHPPTHSPLLVSPPGPGLACGALRAAAGRWPGGRRTDPVVALREARLTSRTCVRARPVGERGNDPVVTRGVVGRDHRIVAQAPGSDGLVPNGRAPASGTAAGATTELGSSPNPAISGGVRSTRARGLPPRPGRCATPVRGGVSGTARPSRRFGDQIDPMGLRSRSNTHGADMTMPRPALIVARCGSVPCRGRFTFLSDRS
jgi:hypothetical protein